MDESVDDYVVRSCSVHGGKIDTLFFLWHFPHHLVGRLMLIS